MRKRKSVFCVVGVGGYPFDVLLAVNVGWKRIERFLRGKGVEITPELHESFTNFDSKGRVTTLPTGSMVLRMPMWDGRPYHRAVLAHEAFHCIEHLFEHIGIKHCDATSEVWAYAIQDLVHQMTTILERA